jgi:hypothetical protein
MEPNYGQDELNKFTLTSACIVFALLEDYSQVIGDLTHEGKENVKERILEKAEGNLQKMKELASAFETHVNKMGASILD